MWWLDEALYVGISPLTPALPALRHGRLDCFYHFHAFSSMIRGLCSLVINIARGVLFGSPCLSGMASNIQIFGLICSSGGRGGGGGRRGACSYIAF